MVYVTNVKNVRNVRNVINGFFGEKMTCENCGENDASVHYQQVVNGKMSEMHLCGKCASEKGMVSFGSANQSPFGNLIAGFMDEEEMFSGKGKKLKLKCKCGWTGENLKKTGYLGCPVCYKTFSKALSPLLRRIHGNNKHIGKKPSKISFTEHIIVDQQPPEETYTEIPAQRLSGKLDELVSLKAQLDAAVKEERYEDAAKFRDRIKGLEIEK